MSTWPPRAATRTKACTALPSGEKGYTKSLQAAYKGTPVSRVVAVHPAALIPLSTVTVATTSPEAKQHTFMQPGPLAEVILFNLINEANLTVTDIEINRNS